IQLTNVTLKYPGLRPWEIWLSEAQERMVFAVPPENLARMQGLCDGQDVELTQLGTFGNNGRLHLFYGDTLVGDLSMSFLHDGIPQRHLNAEWKSEVRSQHSALSTQHSVLSPQSSLLALLAHPDIRSKEDVIRRYDHEVQGGTAVKPLVGIANHGPSDATVIVPQNSQLSIVNYQLTIQKGAALSNGINPHYGELDPYAMAWASVDEAMRNIVAVGADPDQVSILDNFCWGNPNLPDR
ncbi:MAG: phosphoribosylformylglycinamidine synthase subunit PurL, partial [Planctomycetaceae bacterium]|nr:phosphoribosylformylglycinamidine synthase subunit PurL [Planctomycetaceae bacterium]